MHRFLMIPRWCVVSLCMWRMQIRSVELRGRGCIRQIAGCELQRVRWRPAGRRVRDVGMRRISRVAQARTCFSMSFPMLATASSTCFLAVGRSFWYAEAAVLWRVFSALLSVIVSRASATRDCWLTKKSAMPIFFSVAWSTNGWRRSANGSRRLSVASRMNPGLRPLTTAYPPLMAMPVSPLFFWTSLSMSWRQSLTRASREDGSFTMSRIDFMTSRL